MIASREPSVVLALSKAVTFEPSASGHFFELGVLSSTIGVRRLFCCQLLSQYCGCRRPSPN